MKGKAESDRESRWVSSVLFALVECRSFWFPRVGALEEPLLMFPQLFVTVLCQEL